MIQRSMLDNDCPWLGLKPGVESDHHEVWGRSFPCVLLGFLVILVDYIDLHDSKLATANKAGRRRLGQQGSAIVQPRR